MARRRRSRKPEPGLTTTQRRTVENPYFAPEHPEGPGNQRMVEVSVDTKESAVETLYSRKFLGLAQKKAADRIRALWEAEGGKSSSIDYTQDRVDGGRSDPVVSRLVAAHELKRARLLLGRRGYELVVSVCAEGRALSEISPHKRERLTMADNLRADLDDLAAMWGLMTRRTR